ncbi:protein kinase [Fadolivirus algeromassiliense]|jgi:predicted Ser/Thr protein kinase|uniref:Protein kinase n=1 Tax=Fadolivirus FV1/VV64 TaxID=3070911 RepID=A0A7D3UVK6_9VIRU|nr:protein kinase [Fadolivirus algeromassiliense]QKF94871.1 protein kinase [Fadolivirus FV1/VV64]
MSSIKGYKSIKTLKKGGKSLKVTLMENKDGNKIIKKQYNPNIQTHRDSFDKEVRILTKLKDYPYTPKLLHIDHLNYTFYETYCGTSVPKDDPIYMQKMIDRTKELYQKFGLAYIKDGKQEFFVHRLNYCLMDNEIYMIDFGSIKWKEDYNKQLKYHREYKSKQYNQLIVKRKGRQIK